MVDFLDRKKGESSISRYAQANVPNARGKNSSFSNTEKDTPDANIIENLKTATCVTYDIEQPDEPESADMTLVEIKDQIVEPTPTSDQARYGEVQVTETKGGHVFIIDNTPGNKRVFTLHPTGTYSATVDNGDIIEKASASKYTIVTGNWMVNIIGDRVEVIQGTTKINIKNDYKMTVNGSVSERVDGDFVQMVKSDLSISVEGNAQVNVGGNVDMNVDGNATAIIGGDTTVNTSGLTKVISDNIEHHGGGEEGTVTGVVTGECLCPFTGKPHSDVSMNVKASKT